MTMTYGEDETPDDVVVPTGAHNGIDWKVVAPLGPRPDHVEGRELMTGSSHASTVTSNTASVCGRSGPSLRHGVKLVMARIEGIPLPNRRGPRDQTDQSGPALFLGLQDGNPGAPGISGHLGAGS